MSNEPVFEIWGIDQVRPYKNNAKIHSDEQVATLAALIEKHGWTQPIVVDRDGIIIAGHGRRLAAIKLGRTKVPVVVRRDLTPAAANALRLADNRVASTVYDIDLMQSELAELALSEEIDLNILGFEGKELDFLASDLASFDESALVGDVGAAVEEQKTENVKKAAEIDAGSTPIGDAFGFKKITVTQSRRIRGFMNQCESETGKSGADALMQFFDNLGVA